MDRPPETPKRKIQKTTKDISRLRRKGEVLEGDVNSNGTEVQGKRFKNTEFEGVGKGFDTQSKVGITTTGERESAKGSKKKLKIWSRGGDSTKVGTKSCATKTRRRKKKEKKLGGAKKGGPTRFYSRVKVLLVKGRKIPEGPSNSKTGQGEASCN